jgi:hypothetical protein
VVLDALICLEVISGNLEKADARPRETRSHWANRGAGPEGIAVRHKSGPEREV